MSSEIIAGIEVAADALSSKLAELRAEEAKAARTVVFRVVFMGPPPKREPPPPTPEQIKAQAKRERKAARYAKETTNDE